MSCELGPIPLLPLKDVVFFPHMTLSVFVSEEICLKAIEAAYAKDRFLFLSAFPNELLPQPEGFEECFRVSTQLPFDVYDIGTLATIVRYRRLPDGRTKVLLQGCERAKLTQLKQTHPFPAVTYERYKDTLTTVENNELSKSLTNIIQKALSLGKLQSTESILLAKEEESLCKRTYQVCSAFSFPIPMAQILLATEGVENRTKLLLDFASLELKSVKSLSPNGTDLTELDTPIKTEMQEIRDKILAACMSEEAQKECFKQLKRLERANQDSSEASMIRTYLEWMSDLPWQVSDESLIDMAHCKKILEEEHYGLEKVKERILEYLAVQKLNPHAKTPILCFVGPPGVGKTSLGKSIASALGRKFARISLGGVRDEAEIRGHRRTYVGAMPGRIIQALKNLGTNNPVMMLDEIDKLGFDHKGDPSSALLEVLDPEQNNAFSDHYISLPFDLSKTLFLANANVLENIPYALRDRLEIIEIAGYTEEEKCEIAKRHMVPKLIEQNGLLTSDFHMTENSLQFVIRSYTKESGVRNLEKKINAITRKIARIHAENHTSQRKQYRITPKTVREFLGEEPFASGSFNPEESRIGIAIGLAYTQTGGDTLEIEVKLFPGKGALLLTGHLGEVMKESAQTALSYIRSVAPFYNISKETFETFDIHLHVPAGAIPKEGPSAGVSIAMAMFSAILKMPLPQNIALTGEISLNGRILPVGGIREKLLAAIRAGVETVLLPLQNKHSYLELPNTIKRKVHVEFLDSFEAVYERYAKFSTIPRSVSAHQNADYSSQSTQIALTPFSPKQSCLF